MASPFCIGSPPRVTDATVIHQRTTERIHRTSSHAEGTDLDVLIVGAGLSGVDAAYHLQRSCPDRSFAIFEARGAIGGTWDLFRYPGIRSDSDMHTLGYPFRPWRGDKAIADGGAIRDYIEDTARHFDIERAIHFHHRVLSATWSTLEARWTVEYEAEGERRRLKCRFLFMASGYYDYDAGHRPEFPGDASFTGRWVHPQHWPADLDVAGKHVVVIGSGATAITLVPALAAQGAKVTMLQRSPSYIVSRPARDRVADLVHRWLPQRLAGSLIRWKNVTYGIITYRLARRHPARMRALIMKGTRLHLGAGPEVERHFTPRYDPWDQRLCLVPDADLFTALKSGAASIVTDTVERITPEGLTLSSGERLQADVIITATGLNIKLMGGVSLTVDGKPTTLAEKLIYKGMMLEGVPNLALAFGYTNASWTLKVDLVSKHVCRLLNHMRRTRTAICTAEAAAADVEPRPMLDFSSGYVQRADHFMPKQGSRRPWAVHQNYALDMASFRLGRVADGTLKFRPAGKEVPA